MLFQSQSATAHIAALQTLLDSAQAYPCGCSRKDLADAPRGPLGTIYPGICRAGCDKDQTAIRVRTNDDAIRFEDGLQGMRTQHLESESGDFIIRRRDGLIAYQLAVVVDDELQGITEIVRGIDIMDSTARQIWLQRLLGYRTPRYIHLPVVTHPNGDKLSKLTGAPGIPLDNVRPVLVAALEALQQAPPADLAACQPGRHMAMGRSELETRTPARGYGHIDRLHFGKYLDSNPIYAIASDLQRGYAPPPPVAMPEGVTLHGGPPAQAGGHFFGHGSP